MKNNYTVREFCEAYHLDEPTAKRLIAITGPNRTDVDALMAVKTGRHQLEHWALNPHRSFKGVLSDIRPH